MQRAVGKDMVVLCGRGEEIFPFRAPLGCPGFISYLANFAPDIAYSMYEAAVAKDFAKVNEISLSLSPFFKDAEVLKCIVPPVSSFTSKVGANHGPGAGITGGGGNSMQFGWVKSAMDMLGLRGGEVRLPLLGINEKEKAELRDILKSMKILK
jgi:dihydrodipicolinate synthase/N-acetylneuraminate lyase